MNVWTPSLCQMFLGHSCPQQGCVLTNGSAVCTEILGRSRVYPRVVEQPALVPNAFKEG